MIIYDSSSFRSNKKQKEKNLKEKHKSISSLYVNDNDRSKANAVVARLIEIVARRTSFID